MTKRVIGIVFLSVVVGACTLWTVYLPDVGAVQTRANINTAQGESIVVARFDGIVSGWDVALFHRTSDSQWLGYYLAHEAWGWRDVELLAYGAKIRVLVDREVRAEFDPLEGILVHVDQGVVYSRADGATGGSIRSRSHFGLVEPNR